MNKNIRKPIRLNGTPSVWIKRYKSDFHGVGNYGDLDTEGSSRRDDLKAVIGLLCLESLGLNPKIDVEKLLQRGCAVAKNYFCIEFWKDNKFSEREINKNRYKRGLKWFQAFVDSLVICMLAERWDDVTEICDWIDPGIEVDFVSEYQEPQLGAVYKILASQLRSRPMRGIDGLRKRATSSRKIRPKHLLAAIDGAIEQDQQKFCFGLESAITVYRAMDRGPMCIPRDYIDLDASVVLHAGTRMGMRLPNFSQDAFGMILSRESIGLKS